MRRASLRIESGPHAVQTPRTEDVVNGLPRRELFGQQAPGNSALEHIENGVHDHSAIGWFSPELFWFRQRGFEVIPLGIGEVGFERGVFHCPDGGCAENVAALTTSEVKPILRLSETILCPGETINMDDQDET